MRIASWNVNSVRTRLDQVLAWLEAQQPDVLCLQELKLEQDKFPIEAIRELGYHAVWAGQKTYNGVAILSREPATAVSTNIPGFEDHQQRVIAATLPFYGETIRVICAYCPNGQSVGSEKYDYKLKWFHAFKEYLNAEIVQHPNLAVLGDYNIAPADEDVHNPEKWVGQVLVSDSERAALRALFDLGLKDAFRLFEQPPKMFSWWDYRMNGFKRNAGLRIDHVLLSNPLALQCRACTIDLDPRRHEQPSDHAPVVATIRPDDKVLD